MSIKKRRAKGGLNLRVPAAQIIDYKDLELSSVA